MVVLPTPPFPDVMVYDRIIRVLILTCWGKRYLFILKSVAGPHRWKSSRYAAVIIHQIPGSIRLSGGSRGPAEPAETAYTASLSFCSSRRASNFFQEYSYYYPNAFISGPKQAGPKQDQRIEIP